MANFHSLQIKDLRREGTDAVSILFEIPNELNDVFSFSQGQYITLRAQVNGEELRRSYSICSSPFSSDLRVLVKQIADGKFSTFANTVLTEGAYIDVMPPMGNFFTELLQDNKKKYTAFAAGSGITPIISIIRATLKVEDQSHFTLFYGNKTQQSTLFYKELEDLKKQYFNRFEIHYVMSEVSGLDEKFTGRLNSEKCTLYQNQILDFTTEDEIFLCGPENMIFDIKDYLIEIGVTDKAIHFELFTTTKQKDKNNTESSSNSLPINSDIELIIDGDSFHFNLAEDGETILDAAMAVDADVPFACKGGVCCACKAKVIEGKVKMDVNYALDEDEVEEGFVLTCQSHPISTKVLIDFDEI